MERTEAAGADAGMEGWREIDQRGRNEERERTVTLVKDERLSSRFVTRLLRLPFDFSENDGGL